MILGIPNGLLHCKYYPFINKFFSELGAEIITSPDTNKHILNLGTKYCVDEACLPIKIFHGHVAYIKDKCDIMLIPRIMQLNKREFICPKFCGLPEMIKNDIPNLPIIISDPIYAFSKSSIKSWVKHTGLIFTKNYIKINTAYKKALESQSNYKIGLRDKGFTINVALVGHPYNIYDNFANMNVIKKLNNLGIGLLTEENLNDTQINSESKNLFKRPFWTFARNSYGFSTYMAEHKKVAGLVYISSFACGIDSIVIELIKDKLKNFPILILKIDEQTGEAGLDTRLEAFSDMLKRRCAVS
ncbi:2-hydroxyglutaryl-CoA dehydratase [Clostridium tyrobutyricum]|uniref:acyl-CoA dehydratase activase-related protein n=1 Tax=Clostridium tyrobutyricum TaxID=1519 RepID=UPI001C3912F7|nr:acyl-CoA dehydratase activase-related protein [Clostridium tyrobutyricum]MBV4419480.1 2-hydroxyglutaryl-CoA dehydratase [Clostridium tyrobutyricum]